MTSAEQYAKVTPTTLGRKICRLLRLEGTVSIELSLLRNGGVLVSKVEESNPVALPKQEKEDASQ